MKAQLKNQIYAELGVITPDTRQVYFFEKNVVDMNATAGEAKQVIMEKTDELNIKRKLHFDKVAGPLDIYEPLEYDFSAKNLKKHGARQRYKSVLMINVRHEGQVDNKSRAATEEDKITFSREWALYQKEKANQGRQLELIPGLTSAIKQEMNDAGIFNIEDLAQSDFNYYPELKIMAQNLLGVTNANTKTNTEISNRTREIHEGREAIQVNATRPCNNKTGSSPFEFNYTFTN